MEAGIRWASCFRSITGEARHASDLELPVDKALQGLLPLGRPVETPRVSAAGMPRILLGQTRSPVCEHPPASLAGGRHGRHLPGGHRAVGSCPERLAVSRSVFRRLPASPGGHAASGASLPPGDRPAAATPAPRAAAATGPRSAQAALDQASRRHVTRITRGRVVWRGCPCPESRAMEASAAMDGGAKRTCSEPRPGGPRRTSGDGAWAAPTPGLPSEKLPFPAGVARIALPADIYPPSVRSPRHGQ